MISNAIRSAFRKMKERGWTTMYWAIDVHDTILPGKYASDQEYEPYAGCVEVLKWLSDNPCMRIIIFTSSSLADYEKLKEWMLNRHGIRFDYLNENPECPNTDYADFSGKFYFNVLIDDKAGFDPATGWREISRTLMELGAVLRIAAGTRRVSYSRST
jgi:hypothetical protein